MASRTKRFGFGLAAGYGLVFSNILYTMASIPLALHYLGKEEFGLWALAQQIAGYLVLLDFGMSSAISRFLANHKDSINGGEYGCLLVTGALVFATQGTLIALFGAAFALVAPALFAIPEVFRADFQWVLIILTTIGGLNIACRSIGSPLWAFQRLDIANGLGIFALFSNLGMLWLGFLAGWGIFSFAFAGIPALVVSPLITSHFCRRCGYYPSAGYWGKPRMDIFAKVFAFGKDFMLLTAGSLMVNASQIMILSRVAGLDAAATFAVGTKVFSMGQQFVSKVFESAAPSLTEMYVRGDHQRFRTRFSDAFGLSALTAIVVAAPIMVGNTAFISVWTSGQVTWSPSLDCLLGLLILLTTLSRCFVGIFGIIGNLAPIRTVYILEGGAFLLLAVPSTAYYGIIGTLCASLMAHILITSTLAMRSASIILKNMIPFVNVCLTQLAIYAGIVALSVFLASLHLPELVTLILAALISAGAFVAAWYFIISSRLRRELAAKLSPICR